MVDHTSRWCRRHANLTLSRISATSNMRWKRAAKVVIPVQGDGHDSVGEIEHLLDPIEAAEYDVAIRVDV